MKQRKRCHVCAQPGSFPLAGEGFSRRRFFHIGGTALVGSYFADVLNPPRVLEAATTAPVHGTARNCILFFLGGAPSHTDLWDLKEGAWTPKAFNPTTYGGSTRFPQGLLPKTADQLSRITLVRSARSWALVHGLAQSWVQIGRNPAGVLGDIAPNMGSVVSLESQASRKPGDVLPGFVGLNAGSMLGSGYLPSRYAPFVISRSSTTGLSSLVHADGAARFANRYGLLTQLDTDRASGALGKATSDMTDFYGQAKTLIDSPSVNAVFAYTTADYVRYGNTTVGGAALVAKQLLASNMGTRFVQINMGGWDNHTNIYGANAGINAQCAQFDPAFGTLIADLAAAPGKAAGKSLLDETLVVAIGEFGRTVGPVNSGGGRDHFLQMSLAFAGGGTVGGRVIGATDALGSKTVDPGWSGNRDIRIEDTVATIYSALGIDYTTVRHDDPVGRGFEYVPGAKDGAYKPIDEMF